MPDRGAVFFTMVFSSSHMDECAGYRFFCVKGKFPLLFFAKKWRANGGGGWIFEIFYGDLTSDNNQA